VDSLSPEERSAVMALVRHRDTRPELAVREAVSALGFRYRLQGRKLPGRPDLVLARLKLVIFVHGCFWHRHSRCPRTRVPKSRQDFWLKKFEENVYRDRRARRQLRAAGWRVLVVWECQTEDPAKLTQILVKALRGEGT
jgi:DNA mismatch endonuclease (patch repair protein)